MNSYPCYSGFITTDAAFSQIERKADRVPVRFGKDGWRQLAKINRSFGGNFIRAFILKNEIAVYIAAHAQNGRRFDDVLSLHYDEHIPDRILCDRSQKCGHCSADGGYRK